MIVSSPATCAIMRCVCSNFTPPTSFGILYQDPNEVGQSGTERPASLLVTSASGDDEKKSPAGENHGKPVKTAIVRCARWLSESCPLGQEGSRVGRRCSQSFAGAEQVTQ